MGALDLRVSFRGTSAAVQVHTENTRITGIGRHDERSSATTCGVKHGSNELRQCVVADCHPAPAIDSPSHARARASWNLHDPLARSVHPYPAEVHMRLRWGRILGALGVSMLAVNSLPFVPLWLTMPDAVAVPRALAPAAPADCETAAVLDAVGKAHPKHDADGGPVDVAALAAVVAAGQCGTLTALDATNTFIAFRAVDHGLQTLDPVGRPAEAVEGALAVWELGADMQRAGSHWQAAVWLGVEMRAGMILDSALLHSDALDDAQLADVQRRLTRIATSDVDWDVVAVQEERATWEWIHLAHAPAGFSPLAWREILAARQGGGRILSEAQAQLDEVRTRAAVLASGAEMTRQRRHGEGCAAESQVLVAIRGMQLDVTTLTDRCAVLGAFEGGAVVALAR